MPRPRRFPTRCRIFCVRMDPHADAWAASCRTHGPVGAGTCAYVDWLVAIHTGTHAA